jgi:hypothetical protein
MKLIETVIEPYIWNYTQPRESSFSRIIKFDTDMTGAVYVLEITSSRGIVRPLIQILSISATETLLKMSLTRAQLNALAPQSKWSLTVTLQGETFICWVGSFNLRSY